MRIVIIATGSWGDVRPNAVLGQALQQAGYDVVLVAAEEFRTWAEKRGLPFAGLSVNMQAMLDGQSSSRNPVETLRAVRQLKAATVEMGREIADVIRDGDAVLLNEGLLPLVNGALEKHRVRHIHINLQPWVPAGDFSGMAPALPAWMPVPEVAYNRWIGRMVRRGQWWSMGGMGNQIRTQYLDLPEQTWAEHKRLLDYTPSLLLVSQHVLPRPAEWAAHHRVTGYLFDDDPEWQVPPELDRFLADGEKPVYIGFGSMRERNPEATTRLIFEAVKQAGKRAILLSGWAGMGQSILPKDVFLLKYAPHHWLFPHMAAVVHHGGAGTTASALRAGVPSVIVPVMSDQPFWGRRVHDLGAGTRPVPRAGLTVEKLAAAMTEAAADRTMQMKAAELGAKIAAEDGVSQAVSAIQEFLR